MLIEYKLYTFIAKRRTTDRGVYRESKSVLCTSLIFDFIVGIHLWASVLWVSAVWTTQTWSLALALLRAGLLTQEAWPSPNKISLGTAAILPWPALGTFAEDRTGRSYRCQSARRRGSSPSGCHLEGFTSSSAVAAAAPVGEEPTPPRHVRQKPPEVAGRQPSQVSPTFTWPNSSKTDIWWVREGELFIVFVPVTEFNISTMVFCWLDRASAGQDCLPADHDVDCGVDPLRHCLRLVIDSLREQLEPRLRHVPVHVLQALLRSQPVHLRTQVACIKKIYKREEGAAWNINLRQ